VTNLNTNEGQKKASNGLTVIKCECGAEILMVPDVKVMGEAIEVHVDWHKQKATNPLLADAEAERIRDYLTTQALRQASNSTT
jgi:hypothetical protein